MESKSKVSGIWAYIHISEYESMKSIASELGGIDEVEYRLHLREK